MTNDQKAKAVYRAADQLIGEYKGEGNTEMAGRVAHAFADLPADSAARLFDILAAVPA